MTPVRKHCRVSRLRGFTLVELLITISIIGMMASMILFAAYSAQETAKVAKTKALIAKLDSIVKSRWDAYRTRRVPVTFTSATAPPVASAIRLTALRDLMRMEMPDRWNDIADGPATLPLGATPINRPAVSQGYLRKYNAIMMGPSPPSQAVLGQFAGAECLYMIVMQAVAEEGDAREVFKPDDVADTDGDGFPEFIDAWKQPIKFLRWAPGFQFSELQIIGRFPVATSPSSGQTLLGGGSNTNADAGAFMGGAIAQLAGANNAIDTHNIAHVDKYLPSTAEVDYSSPVRSMSLQNSIVLMAPDPFDPLQVCVASASGAPSFALYPLIYSSGPDKCYGVMADFSGASGGLRYALSTANLKPAIFGPGQTAAVNPFAIGTDGVTGNFSLIGVAQNDQNEQNYVPSAWLDNIHNHMLGTR
jgi:prepilin-type N-terminal cleavage/methylation domain-containing protein